ncbi:hypothetical protein [Streptomyces sp. NPDC102370]|uniref:hypothetical protein n=1 Tax=Streptomyces sp. NPDC102370 TaxID=3366163 RepID=UPI0038304A3D
MPHVPQDILDRLAALEREVRTLRGRAQIRPALTEILNGNVVIGEGGRLIVRDPDGTAVLETGQSPTVGDYFTTLRRDDGTLALTIGANSYPDDDAPSQMIRMWSRGGNIIVMDDYHADGWLGRPALPVPWQPTAEASAYSGTATAAWLSFIRAQNPVLHLRTESFTSASSATVELQISNLTRGGGYQTVASWQVPSGAWTFHSGAYPLDGCEYFNELQMRLRHSTSGTGTVTTRVLGSLTRNTFSADEVPDP